MKGTRRKNQSNYVFPVVMSPGVVVKLDGSFQDSFMNLALETFQEKDLTRINSRFEGFKRGDKQFVKISPPKKKFDHVIYHSFIYYSRVQ